MADRASCSDERLQRAQAGDNDAFAELIAAHQAVVYSIAYNFFASRERGEEIAQDVFLQLFRNLHAIRTREHLLFWLRQVTSRKCIDELRRRGPATLDVDDVEIAIAPNVVDPFLARRLRALIAMLPDMQRIVLTLRYQEELGPNEIAEILATPVNTIKSILHRALGALRKNLGDAS